MPLPLSETAIRKLKDLLVCLSAGCLCFLVRWYDLDHLQAHSMDYYRTEPQDTALLWATAGAALALGFAMWLAWLVVERSRSPRLRLVAQCGFLLVLIFPLESVRRYWNVQIGHADIGANLALLLAEGMLAAGIVMACRGNLRIVHSAHRVAFLMTVLFPMLAFDFTAGHLGAEPASVYQPKASLPMLTGQAQPKRRVIWMLFDEFYQRLAFAARPASVHLPELDRLRAESFTASQATQTAPWTFLAVPSLISGEIFAHAELADAITLVVFPEGSHQGFSWRDRPNVFRRARELGANAELIGWHHPYCRVMGDSMVRCFDQPNGHPTDALRREMGATEDGVANTIVFLFRLQWENLRDMFRPEKEAVSETLRDAYVQGRQQKQYFRIRDRAYQEAVDPRIDLLFVHFPAPHLFAIYDRERQDFTLSGKTSYFDNLALVDRTVGEMRRHLEEAGLWDSTTILITADHGLRPELWRGRLNWTPELQQLTIKGPSETVPFIVKLAGKRERVTYDKQFSNVVISDLALAVLSGEVSNPLQLPAWLDQVSGGAHPTHMTQLQSTQTQEP